MLRQCFRGIFTTPVCFLVQQYFTFRMNGLWLSYFSPIMSFSHRYCIIFLGLPQQITEQLITEIYSHTVLETRSLKSKCWQGHASSEGCLGRNLSSFLPCFWWGLQSLAFLGLLLHRSSSCFMPYSLLCSHVFTWLSDKGISWWIYRTHLDPL